MGGRNTSTEAVKSEGTPRLFKEEQECSVAEVSNGVSGRHVGRERQVGAISSTTLQAPFPSGYSEANSRHDRTHTRAF